MLATSLIHNYDFRDSLYKLYNEELAKEKPDRKILCELVKTHAVCDERIRIWRGMPLPGVLKPGEKRAKMRVVQPSVAPLEIQDAIVAPAAVAPEVPAVDNLAVAAAADTTPDIESD